MKAFRSTWRLSCLVLLVAVAPVYAQLTTTPQAATIFGRTTSGVHDINDPYMIGMTKWQANLLPPNATYTRSPSESFLKTLRAAFKESAGWSYTSSLAELSKNSLVVRTYDVLGTATRVGAEFHVEYVPQGTDPTTNLHWIQVITNNHALPEGHGTAENEVDTPSTISPYYDHGATANNRHFYDFPGRNDANREHRWSAELFLVTGPNIVAGTPDTITPGEIRFFGGVLWGWENHPEGNFTPIPEPSTVFAALALLVLLIVRLVYRPRRNVMP